MPKISVSRPFSLRPGTGQPLRDFPVGVHDLTVKELDHWFIKACLRDGRAVLLAETPGAVQPNSGAAGAPGSPGPDAPGPGEDAPAESELEAGEEVTLSPGDEAEIVAPSREELLKLRADDLKTLARECGLTGMDSATKAQIADKLLLGMEGVTLRMGPDGFYIAKAE